MYRAVLADALDDEPHTLDDASRKVFGGAIKPASLIAEAKRGDLLIEKVGRRYLTTRSALTEMRRGCGVDLLESPRLWH